MLTIPPLPDAPRAWAALPEHVRAEAKQYADRFEGHPDPPVAAVVVGQIRAEADRKWRRNLVATFSSAIFVGLSFADLGRTDDDVSLYFLTLAVGVVAMALTLIASRWLGNQVILHRAEAANLRVFLSSADAAPSEDLDRRRRLWSRIAATTAVFAAVAPTVWWLTRRIFDLGFDPSFLRELLPTTAVGFAVGSGTVFLLQNVHRPRYWAKRVSVGEGGVRFGRPWIHPWTPVVPWEDIGDVTIDAPTPQQPYNDSVTVWPLRDGTNVRVALKGSRQPPEEQILSSRAHRVQVC
jgi:hypothetical protein